MIIDSPHLHEYLLLLQITVHHGLPGIFDCSINDSFVGTYAIGHPHRGQADALSETSELHSGHLISAMGISPSSIQLTD